MQITKKLEDFNILLLLKTGLGSAIAIIIADRFNLYYGASAGIITLLTIQNTRKETIKIAFTRILAFYIAIIVSFIIFSIFGYTYIAFGGFIFIFVAICNFTGLQDGIIINSVLITHFLIEKRMDINFVKNEMFLLIIGMGVGIVINSIMPKNMKKIKENQKIVENEISNIMYCISNALRGKKDCLEKFKKGEKFNFKELDNLLESFLSKAYDEAGNNLLTETKYQISYLEMRKLQIVVLKDIFNSIEQIHEVFPQSIELAMYIEKAANEFHELNNVKVLLLELQELQELFRNQELPTNREEFENRAILFNISKELEKFLHIKRSFIVETIDS